MILILGDCFQLSFMQSSKKFFKYWENQGKILKRRVCLKNTWKAFEMDKKVLEIVENRHWKLEKILLHPKYMIFIVYFHVINWKNSMKEKTETWPNFRQ